jgi:hypothetical protein
MWSKGNQKNRKQNKTKTNKKNAAASLEKMKSAAASPEFILVSLGQLKADDFQTRFSFL